MRCENCPYHYKLEGDRYPRCQYPYDDINAPCEYDDYETEDIDDD